MPDADYDAGLTVAPIGLKAANEYVREHHRHHPPTRGHKFSVAIRDQRGDLRGVAIAGRPKARNLDDGLTLEVLRVCTDGVPNGCSMLYGAVRRAALAMGYAPERVFTYTLADEPGTSLRAAGWHRDGTTKGGEWGRDERPRDTHNADRKVRWRAAPPQTCEDCGHRHTPEGCAGEATPSDLWAGVTPAACDCGTRVLPPDGGRA